MAPSALGSWWRYGDGGGGTSPIHPIPAPRTPGVLGGGCASHPCPHTGGGGGRGMAQCPLSLGQPGCVPPVVWGGCPRLHLCDDLAVLRHVDLHGHAVRGAPQDVDRGRLRGRKNPWVPAPCPVLGQHPRVHILGQGLGGGLQGSWLQVSNCPAWALVVLWVPAIHAMVYCMHPPPWDPPPGGEEGPLCPGLVVPRGTPVLPQGPLRHLGPRLWNPGSAQRDPILPLRTLTDLGSVPKTLLRAWSWPQDLLRTPCSQGPP